MSGGVLEVKPERIRFKLLNDLDLTGAVGGDWDIERRFPVEETEKHRAVVQHFVDGVPWIETDLFQNSYTARFEKGERVRDAADLESLAAQYTERMDALFANMKSCGFRRKIDGLDVVLPKVHIGRDGELLLGNQGNHRVAMAKVIGLRRIPVRVHSHHSEYKRRQSK